MRPITDSLECQRDSPYFRQVLEQNEKNLEIFETKLEKIVKSCSQMVTIGKSLNQEQENLVHTMWELSSYFAEDPVVHGPLNCLLDALREAANFHKILIDQAARAVIKNFNRFIKEEMKGLKEKRHWFERASVEMDAVLHRAANVSKTSDGSEEMNKQVWATRQAFRHTAIDYMHALSMAQAKKRHETVDAILSYTKSYNTFFHQGSDLFDDLKPSLDRISKEVSDMREEVTELDKSMENRHSDITGKVMMAGTEPTRKTSYPVTMQGYLFKRTNNAFKSWNRRYFTLHNNQLVYRKRSGEEVTVMEEDLKLCNVKPAWEADRRFCFEITSNVKSHMLQAESEESCQMWIEAVGRAISSAIQHHQYPTSPQQQQSGLSSNDSSFNNLTAGSLSPSPSDSPKQMDLDHSSPGNRWRDILKIPGNDVCCDCRSPDPKWASINLGITLCIECSGIHRSLGVHYSKVRSLTLDKWDLEVTRVMEKLGNEIINHIYLSSREGEEGENDPPPFDKGFTPAYSDCTRFVRETWIKAKYVDKRFVARISNEKSFSKILNHPKAAKRLALSRAKASDSALGTGEESSGSTTSEAEIARSPPERHKDAPVEDTQKELSAQNVLRMESLTPNDLLMTACGQGHLPLICLSLALGASKNHTTQEGRTPLHCSILSRSGTALEYLLLNGVQVNVQDSTGQTPLHLAASEANLLMVYRLIKYRADWRIKDHEGRTPVDHAVQSSEPDLVTLLRVASLSEQLDKEQVDEELMTIVQDLKGKNHLLESREED